MHTGPAGEGHGELALLLDGGGARAAYQAGYLRAVGRLLPDLAVDVLVGVSAGAINATWLASQPGSFGERTEGLARLWEQLTTRDVVDVRRRDIVGRALRWLLRLGSGGRSADPRGLLDNTPLRRFLGRALQSPDGSLPGIQANIEAGRLRALAVTASSYATGQSITFVQGRSLRDWERPYRRSRRCEIRVEHVLASSALPFLFAAEELADGWYGDGGVRLTTPLSPAIHLGADRILAISTRYGRSDDEADRPATSGYPPPAQVAGALLNAIFLDALDGDALRLKRINALLDGQPRNGLRPVDLMVARPSADLGRLATEYEHTTPRGLRFMTRGTGTLETRSNDLLSLILFEPGYLHELLGRGARDAEAGAGELLGFLGAGRAAR